MKKRKAPQEFIQVAMVLDYARCKTKTNMGIHIENESE